MKKLTIIMFLLLFPISANCGISNVTILDQAYSISGSDLGSKSVPGPLAFDSFDGGTPGSQIAGNAMSGGGVWRNETYNTAPVYSADTRTANGLCSSHPLAGGTGVNHAPLWCDFAETNQSTIYVSFWTKFTYVLGSDSEWQLKYWRLTDGTSDVDTNTYFQDLWWTNRVPNLMGYFEFFLNPTNPEWPNYSIEQGYGDISLDYDKAPNEWHYYQFAIKQDAVNGSCLIWIDGQQVASETAMTTFETGEIVKSLTLGWYMGNNVGDGTASLYFDDVYIDNSWKRVEVGDNAIYANCTHREIQPAITWSDTGITGTFNQGSFETGDTVYVFVVDEEGVPSDGYPVTIGGEPSIANPVVEILTESGQTTTASILTITGTATADTGQTISGVTCSGQTVTPADGTWDEQSEAFTCLANLALGENTLVFIGSDGSRTGSDSITVTRIKKTSKINGSATIKNSTIHQ